MTDRYSIIWNRPGEEEGENGCHGLTAAKLVSRLRAAVRNYGSVTISHLSKVGAPLEPVDPKLTLPDFPPAPTPERWRAVSRKLLVDLILETGYQHYRHYTVCDLEGLGYDVFMFPSDDGRGHPGCIYLAGNTEEDGYWRDAKEAVNRLAYRLNTTPADILRFLEGVAEERKS